jgi:hypothetical protein
MMLTCTLRLAVTLRTPENINPTRLANKALTVYMGRHESKLKAVAQ